MLLCVVQDEVTDENHMLQHQDSISKSEIQGKKQRTHKRERLSSKYKITNNFILN